MAIQTRCPSCQTVYALAEHLAGKMVRCKKCGGAIAVRAAKRSVETEGPEERARIQTKSNAPQRPLARTDEKPAARPRRRDRDDEGMDFRRSPQRSNRGLLIGLIVCGAGLFLLLAGGVLVLVLLVAGKSSTDSLDSVANVGDPWPMGEHPTAAPDAVVLHISGVVDENTSEAISEKLHALAAEGGNFNVTTTRRGDRMTAIVRPVHDVQAFSQKLDFGTVDSVNGRAINVTARKVQGPPTNADAVTKALHQLKSTNVSKRHDALRKLKGMLPDDKRRAEVVKALEPLLNNDDHFTRQWAIEALGVWGNKDAVPILLKAMQDQDTRREAMKALGRLKDERAAEPIAERLEELFDRHDAEEALKTMGPMAEKAVLARLNHHDWMVRKAVCDILGAIGTKQSIPALEKVVAAGKDPFSGPNHIVAKFAEQAIKAIKARQ